MYGEAAQAEAVLDEVSILQAALQEVQRKRGIGPIPGGGSGVYPGGSIGGSPAQDAFREPMRYANGPEVAAVPGYNVDLAAYGAQLKAWVDMQVDARLNMMVPQFLDAELGALQRAYQRTDSDIDLVKNAHTKLYSAVECLSEDFEKMKVQSEALAAVEKVVLMVEELKQSTALRDRDPQISEFRNLHDGLRRSHETSAAELRATIDELRRAHDGLHSDFRSRLDGYDSLHGRHDAALEDIRKILGDADMRHRGLLDTHDRLSSQYGNMDSGLAELHAGMAELRRSQNALQESHHSGFADSHRRHAEAEDRLIELGRLHGDFHDRLKQKGGNVKDVEDALITLRDEVASLAKIVQDQDQGNARLERKLSSWQADISNDLAKELKAIDDVQREEARKIRDLQSMQQEVARELEKLPDMEVYKRELRDAIIQDTRHLKSEAAAIAALDEQLWLTDQRLGQRIDQLAHSHRESITVVERRIGNMLKPRENLSPRSQGVDTVRITASSPKSNYVVDVPVTEERDSREVLRLRRPLVNSAVVEKTEEVAVVSRNIRVDGKGRVTEAIGTNVSGSPAARAEALDAQEKPNSTRSSLYASRLLRPLRETSPGSPSEKRLDDVEEETQRISYKTTLPGHYRLER